MADVIDTPGYKLRVATDLYVVSVNEILADFQSGAITQEHCASKLMSLRDWYAGYGRSLYR